MLTALVAAPSAAAQCGGVEKAHPKRNLPGRAPLAIGDSSMLLALPSLARAGYNANARGCRQFAEGLNLIAARRKAHRLPHLVVIALGADAAIEGNQVEAALNVIGPTRLLGLVTPRETGGGESNDAAVIRNAGGTHPDRIKVLDWVRYSAGHPEWFQPDGLHLTFPGAHAFTRLLRKLVPLAGAKDT